MGELRRKYGFWGTVGSFQVKDFVAPEFIWGPLLGGGGAAFLIARANEETRVGVAGDYLALAAALLGVVFAVFALVIALLSDAYLQTLQKATGVLAFLRPFMFATGLQVGAILATIVYRGGAAYVPTRVEQVGFVIVSILFVTALLDVVALARTVMMHGVARASAVSEDQVQTIGERRESRRR